MAGGPSVLTAFDKITDMPQIMGPAKSGSTFHKDPNATSAWNAVRSELMFINGATY